jgi:hypothetical protein
MLQIIIIIIIIITHTHNGRQVRGIRSNRRLEMEVLGHTGNNDTDQAHRQAHTHTNQRHSSAGIVGQRLEANAKSSKKHSPLVVE